MYFYIFFRPFWLSPRQVMVIPVGPTCEKYALQVKSETSKVHDRPSTWCGEDIDLKCIHAVKDCLTATRT